MATLVGFRLPVACRLLSIAYCLLLGLRLLQSSAQLVSVFASTYYPLSSSVFLWYSFLSAELSQPVLQKGLKKKWNKGQPRDREQGVN